MLNGFEYQVYMNVHQVTDEADGRYRILCESLNGKGCEDIETAWQEIIYKDLYTALEAFAEKAYIPLAKALDPAAEKKATAAAITSILTNCKKEALAFYTLAAKTSKSKSKAEASYKIFANRVKLIVKICKAAKVKIPADLQKTLSRITEAEKFTKLMLTTEPELLNVLLAWALAADYAEAGFAAEWNLGRKFNEYLMKAALLEKSDKDRFIKLFVLTSVCDSSSLPKDAKKVAAKITELLVHSKYSVGLSGINNFDNTLWFNKEMIEHSLNTLIMLMALDAKAAKLPEVFKLYKTLCNATLKAAYKCDLLLKQFVPEAKKEKASKQTTAKKLAKQTAPKKAANTTRKNAVKTSAAKKSTNKKVRK